MEKLTIHENIVKKLNYFIENKEIPHIIFYGPSGSGKHELLNFFINKIYNNNKVFIKEHVMYVNCAHGKGIRFIRDELKFFAKTNINNHHGSIFKSIILFNAGNLTTDAQSALRRCIEQFSHTTRFFIIIEDIDSLLKPILSRFCNIYIPLPCINGKKICLHKYNQININEEDFFKDRNKWFKKIMNSKNNYNSVNKCQVLSLKLYERGFSSLDIINYIEKVKSLDRETKYNILIYIDKMRKEFRNEKLLMLNLLYIYFMRKKIDLENIISI
jgi:DNA polymerase III delta prime subunit